MKAKVTPLRAASSGTLWLYGDIGASWWGEGISASDFRKELEQLGAVSAITLRINSNGGDVHEGLAMFNLLREHPASVTVKVDGIAGSIASIIAMSGDWIEIADNARLMIHNAETVTWGDYRVHAKATRTLEDHSSSLAAIYAGRSGKTKAQCQALMDEVTWLDGKEAVDQGFADQLSNVEAVEAYASPLLRMYKNLPTALRALANKSTATRADMVRRVRLREQALRVAALAGASR